MGEFYPFGRALSEGGVLWRDYEGKPLEDEKMRDNRFFFWQLNLRFVIARNGAIFWMGLIFTCHGII